MTDNQRLADDLGKHAAQAMQDVLNRHVSIAQGVLPASDVATMLLVIANGVAMGAALFAMQVARDDVDPGELFDMTADAIPKLMQAGKPTILAEYAKRAGGVTHG